MIRRFSMAGSPSCQVRFDSPALHRSDSVPHLSAIEGRADSVRLVTQVAVSAHTIGLFPIGPSVYCACVAQNVVVLVHLSSVMTQLGNGRKWLHPHHLTDDH